MNLIPRPTNPKTTREVLTLKPDTAIVADPQAKLAADLLAAKLRTATGWRVPLRRSGKAAIRLKHSLGKAPGPESYMLTVRTSGAELIAPGPAGFLHGVQTLRQLMPVPIESPTPIPNLDWSPMKWEIPGVVIKDHPKYAWRGFMIDSGRHFLPVPVVKRVIDSIALYKFNRLHWHLTEDQGWRLAIQQYPKLTSVGAWRGPAERKRGRAESAASPSTERQWPSDFSNSRQQYGGFYTADDVREVVAYATARGIVVVPEIELPGHASAALASYPHLGCTGGPYKVETTWGIFKDVFCAGNEKTFEFLEGVLTEVVKLFPGPYIHLGADECPKDRWKACPKCQARKRQVGLPDEHALQSWFVHRVIKFLATKGKTCICWDEILEGGPPPGVIVQAWRAGAKAVSAAVAAGHQVIHSPYSHVYLNEGQAGCNLAHVHSWDPTQEGERKHLTKAKLSRPELLLGGEACLWGEWCPPERVGWQAYPRLLSVAETLWTGSPSKSYAEFRTRALAQANRLSYLGLTPGPER